MEKGRMIWLMGKVYDPSETAVDEVEKDVEARIFDYTKSKMRVKIGLSDDYTVTSINRRIDAKVSKGMMLEQETWLLTGEGYNGFMPIYSAYGCFAHFPGINYFIEAYEFAKAYKENFEYYTGQKIKKVYANSGVESLTLRIKY